MKLRNWHPRWKRHEPHDASRSDEWVWWAVGIYGVLLFAVVVIVTGGRP